MISRRPSCFGSDEERASGKKDAEDEEAGWQVLRSAAYGSPDGTGDEKKALSLFFSAEQNKFKN